MCLLEFIPSPLCRLGLAVGMLSPGIWCCGRCGEDEQSGICSSGVWIVPNPMFSLSDNGAPLRGFIFGT